MACACDTHPCALHAIPAGLTTLPRALGTFPHWRRELLASVARQPALRDWNAREAGDFGMMLVDFFAYMADVTSFYDGLVSDESYLGTASLPDSARRIVALLGYRPRPALGSAAWLRAEVDDPALTTLPVATAFRSGEFDGNPPQVFESGAAIKLDPRVNRLAVDRVPSVNLPSPLHGISVTAGSLRARKGQILVLDMAGTLAAVRVASLSPRLLATRRTVSEIGFTVAITPADGTPCAETRLLRAGDRAGAWKLAPATGEQAVVTSTEISLDARYAIAAGDIVVVEAEGSAVARRVTAVAEAQYTFLPGQTSTLTDPDSKVHTMLSPAIKTGVTRITVDAAMPFTAAAVATLAVHHAMSEAGRIHVPLKDVLEQGDPVRVPGLVAPPRVPVEAMALEDRFGEAVIAAGGFDGIAKTATPDASPLWGKTLTQPVTLAGNVFLTTRGESVTGEYLGSGDASAVTQRFRLKKKPLTYLAAANAAGRSSTLSVRVGGILWTEVESFYLQPEDATVFIVRHDEAGETDVEFGGGARLPTGAEVVADYRFGAGAAVPPAAAIKQVARPVAGLRSVVNPLPAFGGGDAEPPAEIAYHGPASALLLGRAVSLPDFETAARERAGVRAARAVWRWDISGQRAAVVVSYIGDAQLAPAIRAALLAIAEEDAPISVVNAPPQSATLTVDVDADPRFVADEVADAVGSALFAPVGLPGGGGLLRGEVLGPDGVVFASRVVAAIMGVAGVAALRGLAFDGTAFNETGRAPAAGAWFDFAGGITVNGRSPG